MKKLLFLLALAVSPLAAGGQCGVASWYAHGSRTASGESFNPNGMTAAHRTLPMGTKLKVQYKGRSVVVKVNDRMGHKTRILDLSRGAARKLGISSLGRVCYERL